jgi:hypothetical protein
VAIFSLLNAGYPADVVLSFTLRSINGVFNKSRFREADPDFPKLLTALREIQMSESLHTQIERKGPDEATLIVLRGNVPPDVEDEIRTVRRILKLRADATELTLTLGTLPRSDTEITVLSRSMLDILIEISTMIEVPPKDIEEKRTFATHEPPAGTAPPLRVHWSDSKPADAFAAVPYRGRWFWIDDRDIPTKRSFFFLLLFFAVAESGTAQQVPVITVPAH